MEIEWIDDPSDPIVSEVAALATAVWRAALGGEESPYPLEELAWMLSPSDDGIDTQLGVAREGEDLLGAVLQHLPASEERSSWLPWLVVEPSAPRAQRLAVGRGLLLEAIGAAKAGRRHLINWSVVEGADEAISWSRSVGAHPNQTVEFSRLPTSDADTALLRSWTKDARADLAAFSLRAWDQECPDDLVEPFAALTAVMEDAPATPPELISPHTVETVRTRERRWQERGPHWRVCALDTETNALIGFTELQLVDSRPGIAEQGDTGVRAEYRGRGIARWLKAENLLRLIETRRDVAMVQTTNDTNNAAMLHINRAIGFKLVCRWERWDLKI